MTKPSMSFRQLPSALRL